LSNPFAKIKYTGRNKRLSIDAAYHCFSLAKNEEDITGKALKKYLGSEVDLVNDYALNKVATIEYGFSIIAGSKCMEYAKGIVSNTSHLKVLWTYLMIIIKPDFLFK
jgi:hypothetical protein